MRYPVVLLDLDHTLIDSDTAERTAFDTTVEEFGLADASFDTYLTINREMWRAVERGEMQPTEVGRTRFDRYLVEIGAEADGAAMAALYARALAEQTELFPESRAVLDGLIEIATLGLVTNGLSTVQRTRIDRLDLDRYFAAIVISGEVGHTKPGSDIFDIAFDQLGQPDRSEVLMVGDSLSSDIRGGNDYGIDTCWYNPQGLSPDGIVPTHIIERLAELPGLVQLGP